MAKKSAPKHLQQYQFQKKGAAEGDSKKPSKAVKRKSKKSK